VLWFPLEKNNKKEKETPVALKLYSIQYYLAEEWVILLR